MGQRSASFVLRKIGGEEGIFRKILDNASDCILFLDQSGRVLDVNRKAVSVFGGPEKDLLGKHFTETGVLGLGEKARLVKAFEEGMAGGPGFLNVRIRNLKRQEFVLESSNSPIRLGSECVIMVIARDVTAREKAKQKLRESEEKFRNLAEQSPNMIFTNKKGRVVYANKRCEETMGYKRTEFYSPEFDFLTLIAPEYRERAKDNFRMHMDEEEDVHPLEYALVTKDGRRIEAILTTRLTSYEGEKAILGTVTDITQLKKAEQEVKESEEMFRALFTDNPLAAVVVDPEFRILDVNPRFEELFGWTESEIRGRNIDQVVVPEDKLKEAEILDSQSGAKQVFLETVRKRKDGSLVPVSISTSSIAVEGRRIGYVALYRDITERKKMEDELRHYSEHLEELVEEKTKQLREAERMAAIGETTTMVGHDLRNPLQGIVNMLYLAKVRISSGKKEEIEKYFEAIEKQAQYMDKIVSDLQAYAGPLQPEMTLTSMSSLIDEVLSSLEIPAGIQVSVNIPEKLPKIRVDPCMMKRVFTNLITNALQAMPDGGELRIEGAIRDRTAMIGVEDTGIGIPRENLDKMFRPLFTTKSKGQGMGLSVCKRLVEAHDGFISVESEAGKGSRFTVKMPNER